METKDEIKLHYYRNAFRNGIKKDAFERIRSDYDDEFITKEQYFEYIKDIAIKLDRLPDDEKEKEKHLEAIKEIIMENKDLASGVLGKYYVFVGDISDLLGVDREELLAFMNENEEE